jgi:aminomuconate-semialdehyde/2-hydroxymuconate-6-semialdehyde dehydrogenase
MRLSNFINGEFSPPKGGLYLPKFDPATGDVFYELPDSDALDIVAAVQSANQALQKWRTTTVKERAQVLNRIADLLEKNIEKFASAESRDVGKPIKNAREVDLPRAINNFRFFAAKIIGDTTMAAALDDKAIQYTLREPLGVTGLISPWNFPLYTLTFKIAPSLAMGNTAVCKPSELTPMTAFMLGEIFNEAGLPPGVCNIVFGRGDKAGAALVQHPGVPLISFTGGTETGEKIQKVAGPMLKRVSLELGGKNANIIFKDADLKNAVSTTIRSSFINSGQVCLCGSRVLVQDDIYESFMTEFRKHTAEIAVGDPMSENIYMGPVVSRDQKEKVLAAIEQARGEQARITVGGGVPKNLDAKFKNGYFLEPTIIEDLTNCSDLWQREIFGPVVTVMKFKYAHDAVKWANTSSYGLSASIWTQDVSRAHKVAAQIQAGTVWVNTWSLRDPRVPFGGVKSSGVGREGGEESLRAYSETKTVCIAL